MVLEYINQIDFKNPIAGIHIRRTDRIKKEHYVPIEKYMEEIEDYYDKMEITQPIEERRVFLATDTQGVIAEFKNKYPNYRFFLVDDVQSFKNYRWTDASLWLIIVNIKLLSMCDFVVCTYTSSVCRTIDEYRQQRDSETLMSIKSLQFIFFLNYENDRHGIAILDHVPTNINEIEMKKGDIVNIPSTQWSVHLYKVHNQRTKKKGFIPAFKIEFIVDTYNATPILETHK